MDDRGRGLAQENIERRKAGISEQHDFEFIRKDGTRIYAALETSPITDSDGEYVGALAGVMDITERKHAEADLKRINAELEGFAHTVSHDLKSPLAAIAIANYTLNELLTLPPTEENKKDLHSIVEIINNNINRSKNLIDDLLEMAEAGQEPTDVSSVGISEVVNKVLYEQKKNLEGKCISVSLGDDLGKVRANRTHIYQVFSNLVSNAVKHNDSKKPEIEIGRLGDCPGGGHRYLVRDNGSGIHPDDLENVFVPFFKGQTGETGIGLSTVEKIVKLYGGEIRAYNDNGACFEFALRDYPEE
jgi:signal transduction histidine kinase